MDRPGPMFRGTELPRLLLLLAITLVGVVFFWRYLYLKQAAPAAEPPLLAGDVLAPIKPDVSPEFEGVTDKTKVGLRDTAAYVKLLERARETNAADLARESRRDVLFSHLFLHPKDYRGVPVHILGTASHISHEPSKQSKTGWLYRAWVVTSDSRPNYYLCIFEDAPPALPLGENLSERVVFNGYFLKLMAYRAHDSERAAPMLIGKIGWTPTPVEPDDPHRILRYMLIAIGAMFVISFFRWFSAFRRTLSVQRAPTLLSDRPTEEISPEDLASFLGGVAHEPEKPAEDETPAP